MPDTCLPAFFGSLGINDCTPHAYMMQSLSKTVHVEHVAKPCSRATNINASTSGLLRSSWLLHFWKHLCCLLRGRMTLKALGVESIAGKKALAIATSLVSLRLHIRRCKQYQLSQDKNVNDAARSWGSGPGSGRGLRPNLKH